MIQHHYSEDEMININRETVTHQIITLSFFFRRSTDQQEIFIQSVSEQRHCVLTLKIITTHITFTAFTSILYVLQFLVFRLDLF